MDEPERTTGSRAPGWRDSSNRASSASAWTASIVYLAHEFDPDVPANEHVATFEGLVGISLIRAWGVSNFDARRSSSLLEAGTPARACRTPTRCSTAPTKAGSCELCAEFGISYTPFSPLAGGWLTGKYKRDEPVPEGSRMAMRPGPVRTSAQRGDLRRARPVCGDREHSAASIPRRLRIAWLLAQPHVTAVVVGPRRPEQLEPALTALEHRLSQSEAEELAALFG